MIEDPAETPANNEWDLLTMRLQTLRLEVGEPSYAEIARRVGELRQGAGQSEHAARVARTTVYDAFRSGRARVNLVLVREIALALGAEHAQVDAWIETARDQRGRPLVVEPGAAPSGPPSSPPSARLLLVVMVLCLALNLLGRVGVNFLSLPVYLDMIGTAIAAIALGPWYGVAVGACTNLAGGLVSGPDSLPFALVNITGALVWGYGVRRLGLGRTLPRFLGLNVLVALACSLVAVPVLVLLFGGSTGHGQDAVTDTFLELTGALAVAVGFSNVLISLGDKVISGFVALVACSALPAALRERTPLVLITPDAMPGPPGPGPGPGATT